MERVQRIDLTRIGERDLEARQNPVSSRGAGGSRRTHWVRGHLFLARNNVMTHRKAHIRGKGELEASPVEVTASTSAEDDMDLGM